MSAIPGPHRALTASFKRELLVAARARSEFFNPLIFFLSITMFVPLGIAPDAQTLAPIAPGMIWIIALLSVLLSLDRVFQSDFEDGSLEQMVLSGQSLYWIVIAKSLAHWVLTGLPLALLSPILGVMMALPGEGYVALVVSLLFGTGSLCFIGAIGSALTVALRRGGLLLSLIIIPLYVPVLILGSSSVQTAVLGEPYLGQVALLAAIWLLSLMIAPFAAAGSIKISLGT